MLFLSFVDHFFEWSFCMIFTYWYLAVVYKLLLLYFVRKLLIILMNTGKIPEKRIEDLRIPHVSTEFIHSKRVPSVINLYSEWHYFRWEGGDITFLMIFLRVKYFYRIIIYQNINKKLSVGFCLTKSVEINLRSLYELYITNSFNGNMLKTRAAPLSIFRKGTRVVGGGRPQI